MYSSQDASRIFYNFTSWIILRYFCCGLLLWSFVVDFWNPMRYFFLVLWINAESKSCWSWDRYYVFQKTMAVWYIYLYISQLWLGWLDAKSKQFDQVGQNQWKTQTGLHPHTTWNQGCQTWWGLCMNELRKLFWELFN